MSRLIKCDRCGKEITDQKIFAIRPQAIKEDGTALGNQPFDGEGAWDYCEECAKATVAFLHQKPAGENPPQ